MNEKASGSLTLSPNEPHIPSVWRQKVSYALLIVVLVTLVGLRILYYMTLFEAQIIPTAKATRMSIQEDVDAVLGAAPLIDGHNDFAIWIRAFYHNHIYAKNFTSSEELYGQVDFPRLRQGLLRGQFWSVYVECPRKPGTNFSDSNYYENIHDTLQQIDLVYRLTQEFPESLSSVSTSSDVWNHFHARSPQIAGLLGIEGLHQIGNSASVLRMYYALGVRYATLTHTCHNAYADSSEAEGRPAHGGLSVAGKGIVREMNRLGMIVDLSHTSFDTQRDALAVSKAPVLFSHSGAFSVCSHVRNVPDDVLHLLARNGGVVMMTFYPEHVYCADPARTALSHVVDHMQYVGDLIGYRHVGIGSDFDGMPKGPEGLGDVSKYPDLVAELLRRGVPRADVEGIIGRNILRVLGDVERVASELKGAKPLEDDVKDMFS
ncbi:membrane dipeptidase-domain-containing protein [Hypoxylon sp. NC0597]|nr:membrane dipeptidase-domain-containing protein [Hypoxylon sp. NC0597]